MKKLLLIIAFLFIFVGCQEESMQTQELTANVEGITYENSDVQLPTIYAHSVDMLQHYSQEENVLLSPLSIVNALGMTANGANQATADAFQDFFGVDLETLNRQLNSYNQSVTAEGNSEIHLANSVWLRQDENLNVQDQFLKAVKSAYDAQVFEAPFDQGTVDDVNQWVSDNTKERIPSIVDQLDDAKLLLINALAFDAEWETEYALEQVYDGTFTARDGESQTVPMMSSKEYRYIEGEHATGFEKPYKDKFSFVALLPKENDIEGFINTLTPEALKQYLSSTEDALVFTALPKFKTEFSTSLVDTLKQQGLENAFNPNAADFTNMATVQGENLFIGNVIHKTMMEVDELGTKAGAVTAVIMETTSAPEDPKEVVLDRPFVFAIVDTEYRLPVFIGVLDSIK